MMVPDIDNSVKGQVQTTHPVQGLPRVVRHITGYNSEGKSVFLPTESDDHYHELVYKSAIAKGTDQTKQYPVELNGEMKANHTYDDEPGTTIEPGSIFRIIDITPGGTSPIHRANGLEYAIVIEGVVRMILESGEERIMQRGDIAVQWSTTHRWVNVTGDGLLSARILFVQLGIIDTQGGDEKRSNELCMRGDDYVSGRGVNRYGNDFFEREF